MKKLILVLAVLSSGNAMATHDFVMFICNYTNLVEINPPSHKWNMYVHTSLAKGATIGWPLSANGRQWGACTNLTGTNNYKVIVYQELVEAEYIHGAWGDDCYFGAEGITDFANFRVQLRPGQSHSAITKNSITTVHYATFFESLGDLSANLERYCRGVQPPWHP